MQQYYINNASLNEIKHVYKNIMKTLVRIWRSK